MRNEFFSLMVGLLVLGSSLPSFAGAIDGKIRNSFIGDIAAVPRLGIFIPSESGMDSAITTGGEARFQLYSIDEGLSGCLGIKYMVPSRPGAGRIMIVPIVLNAVYEAFIEGHSTEIFVSGGLGLYPWSASFQGSTGSGLAFGLQAALGAEPRVGPGNLLAEIGYSYAEARYGSRGLIDLGGTSIEIGYRIIF